MGMGRTGELTRNKWSASIVNPFGLTRTRALPVSRAARDKATHLPVQVSVRTQLPASG